MVSIVRLHISLIFSLRQFISTQLLLETFTDGTATATIKRNNLTTVPILPPTIRLLFFISVRDGSYFNTPNLLPFHIFLLFFLSFFFRVNLSGSSGVYCILFLVICNTGTPALQNHLHRRYHLRSYRRLDR